MLTGATGEEFQREPRGRYAIGERWLAFVAPDGEFGGVFLWGQFREADYCELARALEIPLRPRLAPPIAVMFDVSGLRDVDESTCASLAAWVEIQRRRAPDTLARLAIIRPGGRIGVMAEGFARLHTPVFPICTVETRAEALDWLDEGQRGPLLEHVDRTLVSLSGVDPFVRALRVFLEAHFELATAEVAATALGLSPRTFQRRLQQHQLRFPTELAEARVRVAKRVLDENPVKLTALALELGFTSLSHFTNCFRRVTGVAPMHYLRRAEVAASQERAR